MIRNGNIIPKTSGHTEGSVLGNAWMPWIEANMESGVFHNIAGVAQSGIIRFDPYTNGMEYSNDGGDTFSIFTNEAALATSGQVILNELKVSGQVLLSSDAASGQYLWNELKASGQLLLNNDAVSGQVLLNNDAVSGQYLWNEINVSGQLCVKRSGDSMYGTLDMLDNPVVNLEYIDFDLINGVAHQEGRMHWDDDTGGLEVGMKGGTVKLQVGQENFIRVKAIEDIGNGQAVYLAGAVGQSPTAGLALASGIQSRLIGIATEDIPNNTLGYVTVQGRVNDVDTDDFSDGDVLWLSDTTPGGFRNTAPDANLYTQIAVGYVLYAHADEGKIYTNPIVFPGASNIYQLTDFINSTVSGVDSEGMMVLSADQNTIVSGQHVHIDAGTYTRYGIDIANDNIALTTLPGNRPTINGSGIAIVNDVNSYFNGVLTADQDITTAQSFVLWDAVSSHGSAITHTDGLSTFFLEPNRTYHIQAVLPSDYNIGGHQQELSLHHYNGVSYLEKAFQRAVTGPQNTNLTSINYVLSIGSAAGQYIWLTARNTVIQPGKSYKRANSMIIITELATTA